MPILYIVATPIGNLGDMPQRGVEVLKQVDYIACEDTRTSGVLLRHFGISTPTFSFHQHNEHHKVDYLMDVLLGGKTVALISDAGMPGISDPGFLAVRKAHQNDIKVSVIPGASSANTALVASGLPCDRFVFEGFLPPKKGRKTRIEQLSQEDRTIVIFESPHKIAKLLGDLIPIFGDERLAAVCRELTKTFEEILRGSLSEIKANLEARDKIRGEIVLVIAGAGYSEQA